MNVGGQERRMLGGSGKAAGLGLAALVFAALMPTAQATTSFTNGNFTTLTCTGTQTTCTSGNGQLGYNTNVADWTNGTVGGSGYGGPPATTYGYNFLFTSTSSALTTGSGANGADGLIYLYNGTGGTYTLTGSANGSGFTNGAIPGGGNFIAADGAYESAAISQTIAGLTAGASYTVSFYWAAAQQTCCTGATTEKWQVSLGSQTQTTSAYSNPSEGFSGWMYQTFTFTADSTSDLLSFLSIGTPISPSEPPFALLADVTFTQATPEPGTLSMMFGGLGLIGLGVVRSKFRGKR